MASRTEHVPAMRNTDQSSLHIDSFLEKARMLMLFHKPAKNKLFENDESILGYEASWLGVFVDPNN